MLWECFASGGTGALHKIDGIMRPNHEENYVDKLKQLLKTSVMMSGIVKKRVRGRRPINLTQLNQLCQEEWAKMHPTYCGKLVEGYPKLKGNATKYSLSVCKLLTHWECDERNIS